MIYVGIYFPYICINIYSQHLLSIEFSLYFFKFYKIYFTVRVKNDIALVLMLLLFLREIVSLKVKRKNVKNIKLFLTIYIFRLVFIYFLEKFF